MENVLEVVKSSLIELLGNEGVTNLEAPLKEIGVDSFQFIKLCVEVEKKLNIKIPDDKLDISEFANIMEFVEMLKAI